MHAAPQQLADLLSFEDKSASLVAHLNLSRPPNKAELQFALLFAAIDKNDDEQRDGISGFEQGLVSQEFVRRLFDFLTADSKEEGLEQIMEIVGNSFSRRDDAINKFFTLSFDGDCLERSVPVNQLRAKYISSTTKSPNCIVVQCFAKSDTLQLVLESLLNTTSSVECNLVILQDSLINAKSADRYIDEHQKVGNLLEDFSPLLLKKFSGLSIFKNRENLGTALSCRLAIDLALKQSENFLFLEDDCVVAPDAIDFFAASIEKISVSGDIWFASCESPFFNAADRTVSPTLINKVRQISEIEALMHLYTLKAFVPSTCFISKESIWERVRDYRCMPRGPESLSRQLRKWNKRTLLPVIPRGSDIGMSHPLGYSTRNKGEGNVKEQKNVLTTSKQFEFCELSLSKISPSLGGLLYQATSLCNEDALTQLSNYLFEPHQEAKFGGAKPYENNSKSLA